MSPAVGQRKWFAHVMRKHDGYIWRSALVMELSEKTKRGRPKKEVLWMR